MSFGLAVLRAGGGRASAGPARAWSALVLLAVAVAAAAAAAEPAAAPATLPAPLAPAAAGSAAAAQAADPVQHQLSVQRALLLAEGSMLEVRFTVTGASRVPVEPGYTYIIDEASGEHLEVANLVRVGPLAQRRKRADGGSFMVFDNRFGHLLRGGKVSVVVGGLKQEHVVVE